MSELNQKNKPVIIIGLTILFLIAISYLPSGITVLGYKVKPVDLFIDIKPDSLISSNANELDNEESVIPLINFNNKHLTASISLDLIMNGLFPGDADENSSDVMEDITFLQARLSGNVNQMNSFFNALKSSRTGQVRIAHFGDSEIEGDLITSDFRQKLQQKFGGKGVGFLSITSDDIMFRTTTKHTFSSDWDTHSILFGASKNNPVGINGFVSVPTSRSWVKYQTTGRFSNISTFNTVKVYYTDAVKSKIKYSFDNGSAQTAELTPGRGVQELVLKAGKNVRSFKLMATQNKQAKFYGVSLESGSGVYVDNFPLRGNSGVSLRDIQSSVLKGFDKYLDYDLVILSFGLNIASANLSDYTWYEKEMTKAIKQMQRAFPNASFLIVGVGDKGIKKGSRFVTDPNILKVIKAQKNIAANTNIAFWNLFDAMGGENSMTSWVNSRPPLASKDYTHVTLQGAAKVAGLMTEAILKAYGRN